MADQTPPLTPAPTPASLDPMGHSLTFYIAPATGAVYIPLPRSAWHQVPGLLCYCPVCKGHPGHWDTLVVPGPNDRIPYTFSVHFPELHGPTPTVPDWLTRGHVPKVGTST